jgi:hypothetical protein
MIEKIKRFLKNVWNWLLGKTTVDEKAVAAVLEIKRRYKLTTKELKDVAKAISAVGNQIEDIPNALKGEKRKGRKNGKNK